MTVRLFNLMLFALLVALTSLPVLAHCRPENRVWGFSEKPADFASQETDNPIAASGEKPGCGYDCASGVQKYVKSVTGFVAEEEEADIEDTEGIATMDSEMGAP